MIDPDVYGWLCLVAIQLIIHYIKSEAVRIGLDKVNLFSRVF